MLNHFGSLSVLPRGARYSLLAYTSLGLAWADGGFQSHSLIVLQDGKSNTSLDIPIYRFALKIHFIACFWLQKGLSQYVLFGLFSL